MKIRNLLSVRNLVLISIILFPFDQLFSSAFPNFPISPFRVLTLLLALLFFRYNINSLKQYKGVVVLFYLYCGWSFLSFFWSSDGIQSLGYSFQILLMIWFAIVAISELIKDKSKITNLLIYGPIAGGIVAQLGLLGVFSERELSLDHRLSFAGIGVNSVAISIGYMFIMGISFLFIKGQRLLFKLAVVISCIIMFYFMIRTGTRSGVYGVLLALGIAYLFSFEVNFFNLFRFVVFFCLLVFSLYFILDNYIGDRLVDRIFSISSEDFQENSRNRLWSVAYDYFSYNILGTGAGNESVAYIQYGIGPREAHNIYYSSLLQLGFVGFFLIVAISLILSFNLVKIKSPQLKFIALSLFSFLFMQMLKGSFLQTRLFWIPLIVIIAIAVIDLKNRSVKRIL